MAAAAAAVLVPSLAASVPTAQASVSAGGGAHRSAPPARHAPVPAARPGTGKQAAAVARALKLAKFSGQPVPAGSGSSVNPDGTVTVTAPASSKDGAYQVALPSQLRGATVKSASVTAAAACSGSSRLSLSVTRPNGESLGSGSTWNSSSSAACGSSGTSLPVTSAVRRAVSGDWQGLSFKVGAPSGTKVSAPKLRVTYAQPASAPSALAVTSGTLKDAGCAAPSAGASSSSPSAASPAIVPGQAATLQASVANSSGLPETAVFTYWVKGSSKKTTVTSAPALSGQDASVTIPASVTKDLGKNAVIDWTASAVSPSAPASASAPSATCAMAIDAAAEQGAPTISGGPAADPTPGTQETWTVTAAAASQSGVTPTAVVWGLDAAPPVSDPPSDQVTQVASGDTSAQVQAVVPSPGPHAFYAYVEYSDGSVSSTATSTFSADSDPAITCPDFGSALTNTGCVQADGITPATSTAANTMISNGSGDASGTADANGNNESFSASKLEAAGWKPGSSVTVDGATFTLPQFGSSSSGPDNLLAAGQTIDMPPATEGSSLVFLVAGTTTDTQAPAPSQIGDPVSPALPAGVDTVGQDCDVYQANYATGVNCDPAPSGTITYGTWSGTSLTTQGTQNYDLEAPGWEHTTPSITPVTLPEHSNATGLSSDYQTGLYAVTVPLNGQTPVAQVTLPDVGAVVAAADGFDWPAIHVLGMQVVDTTSVTGSLASAVTQPAVAWTGTWASPPEAAMAPKTGSSYSNQTIRLLSQVSTGGTQVTTGSGTSAQTGIAVRLRLSDALAAAGSAPLTIGAVTVGQETSGAAISSALPVTFGGSKSVTIPEGSDVYSDPVIIPTLSPGELLAVSVDLSGSYASLPTATHCNGCAQYVSASGSGDKTADTTGTPFTGTGTSVSDESSVVTGIDVLNAGTSTKPTVAVLGNGVIDGNASGSTVGAGDDRVSDDLASSLQAQPGGPAFGVINAGVEANQVVTDADTGTGTYGGPSALTRLARDVLAEPNVGTVVIDEGDEDLLKGTSEEDLYTNGLMELSRELTAWGITTIWATQHACGGYAACTADVDNGRATLNTDLLAQGLKPGTDCSAVGIPGQPCQYTADFAAQVDQGDGTGDQDMLTQSADAGDGVNLTETGYAAETKTIPVIAGTTPLAADQPPSL